MHMKNIWMAVLMIMPYYLFSQNNNTIKDSLYIEEVEEAGLIPKVLHAEPLYIDLIRDLGARKGEKEWNVGFGLTDNGDYDMYTALVEYEWAPVDRLGLEVELPFSIFYPTNSEVKDTPGSKLNSLKMAMQYSFYVSEKYKTSMAFGYIQEFELTDFNKYGKGKLFTGNVYNPFFVAAKRWKNNFHTLLYTGPAFMHHFEDNSVHTSWQINTNFHYMITGTRNFVGVEFNKTILNGDFDMTIRPQMRVGIADNVMVGIVAGIPIKRENERFSSFIRLIYEPAHKKK
ncbi:HAEPLYID family protein [uncultured Chryseobacterium sp.]|uniref:HAEPLYID family protein n=1 Tax=uncultured Chryseobacterium sp. TaxID=259322 RepID=UPI00262F9B6F|nr:HAEPLYID family protein [uncultured Chryseobacterium sp.]